MRSLAFLGTILLLNVLSTLAEPVSECKPETRNGTYRIADSKQCDKYYDCTKAGKITERLCRDGYDYATEIEQCDFPFKVNCGERTERQPPLSTNPLCERLYGMYPFKPEESCAKFYHCQEGIAHENECPYTSIYDPTVGTCVHPGAANRKECSASEVFDFKCPNFGQKFAKLRFFDHDRLKHPEDCRKFFACFTDGQPRLLSCPYKTVFYEKAGRCLKYQKHPDPECNTYYKKGGKGYKVETDDDDSNIDDLAIDSNEQEEESHQKVSLKKDSKQKPKSKRQSAGASVEAHPSASQSKKNSTSGNKIDKSKPQTPKQASKKSSSQKQHSDEAEGDSHEEH